MTKSNKYVWGVIMFCFLAFISYFSYNSWKSHRDFYCMVLSDRVTAVQETPQGFFKLKLNTSWIYLWTDGACIHNIQKGDSVFKSSNSLEIIIKRQNEGYKSYLYDCSK